MPHTPQQIKQDVDAMLLLVVIFVLFIRTCCEGMAGYMQRLMVYPNTLVLRDVTTKSKQMWDDYFNQTEQDTIQYLLFCNCPLKVIADRLGTRTEILKHFIKEKSDG